VTESEHYVYDSSTFHLSEVGSVRIDWDAAQSSVRGVPELKSPLSKFNAELRHLPYDLRATVAHERPLPDLLADHTTLPAGFKCKRRRERHSIVETPADGSAPLWRLDLTKVVTSDQPLGASSSSAAASVTTFELEVELLDAASVVPSWLDRNGGGTEAMMFALSRLWPLLSSLLSALGAGAGGGELSSPLADLNLEHVVDEYELETLRKTAVEWVPNVHNENSFPGAMPVAFSRRHMRLIQTTEYMVSEKSDGLRYMLLINSSGTYLFDRNFEFSLVHGYDVLTQLFAANEVTVLDGELVRHQKSSRPMFLIFDAVVIDGSPVGSKKLNERLDAVRTKVIEPYRAAVEQQRIDESKVPFMLIGKAFHAKKHLGTLFSHVKRNESGDRVYVDNRRNHKTDGVIFTPVNSPYRPTPAAPILKWKFVDKLSADLKIMFDARQQKWCLYCTGDRHTDIEVRSVEFSPEDTARLSDDIRQRPNSDGTYVIECTYDIWAGRWHYASIRADKKQGNHVRTVFDTLEVIAENISEQEISYRVPRAPQDDHWQARMTDAMQRMNQSAAAGNNSGGGGGGSARHTPQHHHGQRSPPPSSLQRSQDITTPTNDEL
jgi:mRNA guanylyltransferase